MPRIKSQSHPYFSRRETVNHSLREGVAYALMVAFGETYFPAFLLAGGLGNIASGLITTLPLLFGASLQLLTPLLLVRFHSHRRWVVTFTCLQGLAILPLIYFAAYGGLSLEGAFLCAFFYSGTGVIAAPVWNTWITRLLPESTHAGFFAERNRLLQWGSLIGFLGGGIFLRYLSKESLSPTFIFVPLFSLAFVFRSCSVYLLYRQPDLPFENEKKHAQPSPRAFLKDLQSGSPFSRVALSLLASHFAVQIGGPFFNPYLLDHLHFNYAHYALLITAGFAGKILAFPFVAARIRTQGAWKVVRVGALGLCFIPIGFLAFPGFFPLLGIQAISGILWATFDLASFLLIIRAVPENARTCYLAYYNFSQAFCVVAGSLVGSYLMTHAGSWSYASVFLVSSVARIVVFAIAWNKNVPNKKAEPQQKAG